MKGKKIENNKNNKKNKLSCKVNKYVKKYSKLIRVSQLSQSSRAYFAVFRESIKVKAHQLLEKEKRCKNIPASSLVKQRGGVILNTFPKKPPFPISTPISIK